MTDQLTDKAKERLLRDRKIMRRYRKALPNAEIARQMKVSLATVNRVIRRAKESAAREDATAALMRAYERELIKGIIYREGYSNGFSWGYDEGFLAAKDYQPRIDIRSIRQQAPKTPADVREGISFIISERQDLWLKWAGYNWKTGKALLPAGASLPFFSQNVAKPY